MNTNSNHIYLIPTCKTSPETLIILYNINIIGAQGTNDPIGRLQERKGKGLAEGAPLETPSKRTKKTDKAKLVRQVNA